MRNIKSQELFLKAINYPVKDYLDFIDIPKSLERVGIEANRKNIRNFHIIKNSIFGGGISRRGSTIAGMRLGPRAIKLGWELFKNPAVYEIVCKTSGRKYIGSSLTPNLRRAVHLFWLKNYGTYNSSNVFFGSPKLKEDVELYGPDDFYIDIIMSVPGATTKEIEIEEKLIIKRQDSTQLYNRYTDADGFCLSAVATAFPELEAAEHEHYIACKNFESDLQALKEKKKKAEEHFANVKKIRKEQYISNADFMPLKNDAQNEIIKYRLEIRKFKHDFSAQKTALARLSKNRKEKLIQETSKY